MKKRVYSRKGQLHLQGLKPEKSDHGGSLKNPQKRKRPLGFQSTTHIVLRSTKAVKKWSFHRNARVVEDVLNTFSKKYHVYILKWANVGNHLHLHVRIMSRDNYRAFIRAVTSAIATRVTKFSRWNKAPGDFRFWDQRPFSRIAALWQEFINLSKYVEANRWEGLGADKEVARDFVNMGWLAPSYQSDAPH